MTRKNGWAALAALVLVLAPAPGRAQFIDTYNPFALPRVQESPAAPTRAPAADAERSPFRRLHVGAYATFWEFSTFTGFGPGIRLEMDADPSILLSAEYFLTRHLSVGGWWNPINGTIDVVGGPSVIGFDANFWDVHAAYHVPPIRSLGPLLGEGWAVQVGFSQIDADVRSLLRGVTLARNEIELNSMNLWLQKSWNLGAPRIAGARRGLSLLTSFGYYTASDFDRALNAVVGGSIDINDRLSLNSSVWFHNFDDLQTRITAGLTSRF